MNISRFIVLSLSFLVAGCAGQPGAGQRVALDSLATGVGGAAAYYGSGRDPALTTAGAVGGFVVSEAFQSMAKSGRQKAYNSGLEEGKALGQEQILKGLWEESNGLPKSRSPLPVSPVLVPARIQNGVLYDAHSASPISVQPEKILIPSSSATNSTFNSHYEQFQQPE